MIWESFGGWFNSDPAWLTKYHEAKLQLIHESGLTERQLDQVMDLLVQKDILSMN